MQMWLFFFFQAEDGIRDSPVTGVQTCALPIFVLMAVEQGTSSLNWVSLGNFFGRSSFATLMGLISVVFNIGMLITPIYAGVVFDRTDSYSVVLVSFLPIYLMAGFFFLMTRKPPPPALPREMAFGR